MAKILKFPKNPNNVSDDERDLMRIRAVLVLLDNLREHGIILADDKLGRIVREVIYGEAGTKRIPLNPAEIDKLLKQHGFFKGSINFLTPNLSDPLSEKEYSERSQWQIYRRPGGQPPRDRDSSLAWIKESSNYWQIDCQQQIVARGCLDDGSLAEFLSKSFPGSAVYPLAEQTPSKT